MNIFEDDIKRLNFEDYIWIIFAVLSFLNIYGDNLQKEFLITNNKSYENKANDVFLFVLIIGFFIYLYFLYRNYRIFLQTRDEEKGLFLIKLMGSALLLSGSICLIYFQYKQTDFIGTPGI